MYMQIMEQRAGIGLVKGSFDGPRFSISLSVLRLASQIAQGHPLMEPQRAFRKTVGPVEKVRLKID